MSERSYYPTRAAMLNDYRAMQVTAMNASPKGSPAAQAVPPQEALDDESQTHRRVDHEVVAEALGAQAHPTPAQEAKK